MKLLLLLLLSISLSTILFSCQSPAPPNEASQYDSLSNPDFIRKIKEKAISQVAMCRILYDDIKGEEKYIVGMGFILNEDYFGTCWHVYRFHEIGKIKEIKIYYNLSWEDPQKFDTVLINLNYEPTTAQYNFKEHPGDSIDAKNDFVLLKFNHPILSSHLQISDSLPKINERLFSFGSISLNNTFVLASEESNFIFLYNAPLFKGLVIPAYIGSIKKGSSGCPVFNSKGEAIGISSFGWESYHSFKNIEREIPSIVAQRIELGYATGQNVACAMDLKYLTERYCKGYVHVKK